MENLILCEAVAKLKSQRPLRWASLARDDWERGCMWLSAWSRGCQACPTLLFGDWELRLYHSVPWQSWFAQSLNRKLNRTCGFVGSGELLENWMLAAEPSNARGHAQHLFTVSWRIIPQWKPDVKRKNQTEVERFVEWKVRVKPCGYFFFFWLWYTHAQSSKIPTAVFLN